MKRRKVVANTEDDDPTGYGVSGLVGRGQDGHNCSVCGEGGEVGAGQGEMTNVLSTA